jgi:hypothetical protein
MIGDHKQLRPKAEHYQLTVESKKGYDLNCSLFERLARRLPVSTLATQWRMHPSIASIPRLTTYPKLIDAPRVIDHPEIRGLQPEHRVIFIDHRELEDARDELADKAESVSKTNKHEVGMVVSIVRYLCQQGYSPSDLVVLTPYLGQLLHLKAALSDDWKVLVGDTDFNEAKKLLAAGFSEPAIGGEPAIGDDCVRVATVDNYQGEEADIVIVSLVRSNADGNIGFLREPERVNVMLSRAKHCEIIIGNSGTLQQARPAQTELSGGPLWTTICRHLQSSQFSGGGIFTGLPVQCQSHPDQQKWLTTPGGFLLHAPEGGCMQVCGKTIPCGHHCSKKCHPTGQCHTRCNEKVKDACDALGHELSRVCSGPKPKCREKVKGQCARKMHNIIRACSDNARCTAKISSPCDGRTGNTHQICHLCHQEAPACNTCKQIDDMEKKVSQLQEQAEEDARKWEASMDVRRKTAERKAALARKKMADFAQRKADELALSLEEVALRQLEREQIIREENSTEEIAKLVHETQREADRATEVMKKKQEQELQNRIRQAEQSITKIEREQQADERKLNQIKTEKEAQLQQLIQERTADWEQLRNANAAEGQRIAAELAAESEKIQRDGQEKQAELEQERQVAVKAQRNERDRLQLAEAAQNARMDQALAQVPANAADIAAETRNCSICFCQVGPLSHLFLMPII